MGEQIEKVKFYKKDDFYVVEGGGSNFKTVKTMDLSHAAEVYRARQKVVKRRNASKWIG